MPAESAHLFSDEFCRYLREISGEFQPEYRRLLKERKLHLMAAVTTNRTTPSLHFRDDLSWIRSDKSWRAPPLVPDLEKRWVEITGPASDRKLMINALNSGADNFMADLEDSASPHWIKGVVASHQNLYDACRGTLTYEKKGEESKMYSINADPAALQFRPRGLHMYESHVIDESGRPMPAGLFDVATFIFHNS